MYSDTDSVYFMSNNDWDNQTTNIQMKKIADIHCDDKLIGMCKFETQDDVGNCLEEYNKKFNKD